MVTSLNAVFFQKKFRKAVHIKYFEFGSDAVMLGLDFSQFRDYRRGVIINKQCPLVQVAN
jgi:hypothetical protein